MSNSPLEQVKIINNHNVQVLDLNETNCDFEGVFKDYTMIGSYELVYDTSQEEEGDLGISESYYVSDFYKMTLEIFNNEDERITLGEQEKQSSLNEIENYITSLTIE